MKRHSWLIYLLICAPIGLAYFVLPSSALSKLLLYNGLGLLAVCAMVVGVRRNRPQHRRAWYFFIAGQVSFLTADVLYYVLSDILHHDSYPSIADAFYLMMYPLVITGLVMMLRASLPGRDAASLIDAAIISVCSFAFLWVWLIDKYVIDDSMTFLARATSVMYPVMDVALLAVLARLAVAVSMRRASLMLMFTSIGSLLIADTGYALTVLAGTYETGGLIDSFWMVFYCAFAAAALHPSSAAPVEPAEHGPGNLTTRRLLLLTVATCSAPVANLIWGTTAMLDRVVKTVSSVVLFLLVLARVWLLMRAVRSSQERLQHQATHDALTGLANRSLFTEEVERSLRELEPEALVGVLFVDIDDFKNINDSLGHEAGDDLLKEMSRRLVTSARPDDLVARLGGDEFAILMRPVAAAHEAVNVATRVLGAFSKPAVLAERDVKFSASIGIAVEPAGRHGAETLLRDADVAMYLAKSNGKRRYEFFEQSMYDAVVERLELRSDLALALERNELEVYYQPVLEMRRPDVVAAEALLRWNHPTRGMVMPNVFIPIAEESGAILAIGGWVLEQACRQVKVWQEDRADCRGLGISVNLSVGQLHDPALVSHVADVLHRTRLDPTLLTLEITESVLMTDANAGSEVLKRLKALGVKIAIDDFGTGYSSFAYLRRFSVDTLKIDRSFVMEVRDGGTTAALVSSVIDLAKALSLTTVAEGVEEAAQLGVLDDLECDYAQGYFFAKPMTVPAFEQYLDEIRDRLLNADGDATARSSFGATAVVLTPEMSSRFNVEVQCGLAGIERMATGLDDLHDATNTPVMARRRWLSIWAGVHNTWEPLAIGVRNRRRRSLDAVALLAQRPGPAGLEVVGMGHAASICTRLPGRDSVAAAALSEAMATFLGQLPSPWRLDIEQLPSGDPVAVMLVSQLAHAHLVPDTRIPRVALPNGRGGAFIPE